VRYLFLLIFAITSNILSAQPITTAGEPAQLEIRQAGEHSIRIVLRPQSYKEALPFSPALVERTYPAPALVLTKLSAPVKKQVGTLMVEVTPSPLTVNVTTPSGAPVQQLVFNSDNTLSFALHDAPVLGMGEGGHKAVPGIPWRTAPIEFDRRGRLQDMQPRWQGDSYGSRNPVALMIGTDGWALFVATPWGQVDLRAADHGVYLPWQPTVKDTAQQNEHNQQQAMAKGVPPAASVVPGLYDCIVFDAHQPAVFMKDLSLLTGPAVIPPKWSLGYMQSHRTIRDENYILGIVDSFRSKKIPVDAVIYLGTGFTPQGWNTKQPSFDFNPAVFHRDPAAVLADFHARHVRVVLHMVPFDRDKLPYLDDNHMKNYWQLHVPVMKAGADAFWPDEGDWFNLYERVNRHRLYYEGPLSTYPNLRPWSLHRNGYLGVARWGGWVWSGDTESSWKTLEGQIAVGINHSLSLGPYWGSDIGGFYPSMEKTGELFARWFQFGAFCPSFRTHGRTTNTILPWGWNMGDRGDLETRAGTDSEAVRRNVLPSEMHNPEIEPVIKKYDELRYQLLPYTYTLAWEARQSGLPLMRALWLYYPQDTTARAVGNEYLWGRDLLIAPVYQKGATTRDVYLPHGLWYDWWDVNSPAGHSGTSGPTAATVSSPTGGTTIHRPVDLTTMPIYVRAGAIIPFDPIRQYTAEPVTEPTTLRIYPGADGDFTLYEDDGTTLDYLKGKATWIHMTWNDKTHTLSLTPGAPSGSVNQPVHRTFQVRVMTGNTSMTVKYDGAVVNVKL
jgi:alpha-glucosidase (family GH31 glycosyl hydrolase)